MSDDEIGQKWRLIPPTIKCSWCFESDFELKPDLCGGTYVLCKCGCQIRPLFLDDAISHGYKKGKQAVQKNIEKTIENVSALLEKAKSEANDSYEDEDDDE